MAFVSNDERALVLAIADGVHEDPPWSQFLRLLAEKTAAAHVILMTVPGPDDVMPPVIFTHSDRNAAPLPTSAELMTFDLIPQMGMRPNRVYALDELLDYDSRETLAQQRDALAGVGIGFARVVRVSARSEQSAVLALLREQADFRAADAAMLSALVPHVAAALRSLWMIDEITVRATAARQALDTLGVGQVMLDSFGRLNGVDATADHILAGAGHTPVAAGRRLQLLPRVERALEKACAELTGAPSDERRVVRLDERTALDMMLRPAPPDATRLGSTTTVIGLVRSDRRESIEAAAEMLVAAYGLSRREAALAAVIAQGEAIVAAGKAIGLTAETSRNYSKRIYAKTGATGQADLVRMILTGLAPFAS